MSDWKEKPEVKEADSNAEIQASLNQEGIQSMQGHPPEAKAETETPDAPQRSLVIEEDGKQIPLEEYLQPPYDPADLKYETRSPHEDYQTYKDLEAAKRQHELGQAATTADSFPDAVDATLAARKEGKGEEETPMDEWFYKKHGRTPYTTDVYAQDKDE